MATRYSERWRWVMILGIPLLGAALYLGWAWLRSGASGYPLDDAWIHHVYASSLAQRGELTFNPGEPSAGSTSPLWSALLAIGHWIGAPVAWGYTLGVVALMACGWLIWRLAERLLPNQSLTPWIATAAVLLEWHLAWAAVSGMETLLFVALSLGAVEVHLTAGGAPGGFRSLGLGLLGGLLFLTRPEGFILVGLVGLDLLRLRRWGAAWRAGLACAITALPAFWLNWRATGGLLPGTFAAKTTYVTGVGWLGHLAFLGLALLALWTGSLLLLLPASARGALHAVRADARQNWLPVAWSLGLLAFYAWLLPVLYHHARYLMPIIPWVALYGSAGLLSFHRRLRRFLFVINTLVLLIFWFWGANIYSWNVDNIQDQQVTIGHWLAEETPVQTTVAANDVGALGYFGERRIIDLEGLITPEIAQMRAAGLSPLPFLREQHVEYLVIYRDLDRPWLAELSLVPVFTATLEFNTISAAEQMIVYRVDWQGQ